ncbi:methyl-accepting chemotaxis protein [Prosthecomicrobium sp. N25]|uniref:methyl-accepting chemotaxis protein n=1 Tax=Prosthecomicrobium sp. N25 TaxID=3129254 RepID=UPI0030772219
MFARKKSHTGAADIMEHLTGLAPEQAEAVHATFRSTLAPRVGPILDGFYAVLQRSPAMADFLAKSPGVAHLKKAQEGHWTKLLGSPVDEALLDRSRRIGVAHVKTGLLPRYYVASYSYLLEHMLHAALGEGSRPAVLASGIVRAILLDMAAALDAYVDMTESEARRQELDQMAESIEEEMRHASSAMQKQAETLTRVVADMAQAIEGVVGGADTVDRGSRSASTSMASVASAVEELAASSREVGRQAEETSRLVGDARQQAEAASDVMNRLSQASDEVRKIVELINEIAQQTNLLALNATIEAARAGELGRGFAIVAQEVKQLSQRTGAATQEIASQINAMAEQTRVAVGAMAQIGQSVKGIDQVARSVSENASGQMRALEEVTDSAHRAAQGAGQLEKSVGVIQDAIASAEGAKGVLVGTSSELAGIFQHLESRLIVTVRSFANTDSRRHARYPVRWPCSLVQGTRRLETRMVEISLGGCLVDAPSGDAVDAAADVEIDIEGVGRVPAKVVGEQSLGLRIQFSGLAGTAQERLTSRIEDAERADQRVRERLASLRDQIQNDLESALEQGRITEDQLFDIELTPIPQTNPQQHRSRSLDLLETVLPRHLEAALDIDKDVIFCVAADRNGYLPCHNRKYSQPQGADPVWNNANCRNRRVFDDRTGLTAARNTKPFLCQTYPRDLGGGRTVLMKDLSTPITVRGRHWGGLRLGMALR